MGIEIADERNFDDEYLGRTAHELFAELLATRPESNDLVVAHGDARLPNSMAHAGEFSGLIDCGRLAVSDRYQDLAQAARSIARNLGQEWIAPFFRELAWSPMANALRHDEFF